MPHQRSRNVQPIIVKKLKLWPVVGLLGLRQCGKSTLLRELLKSSVSLEYQTLDSKTLRSRAESNPDSFSEPIDRLLVIDEVQKVPSLFDSIKKHVDEKRRPGKYLLSGSAAFSDKIGIRESLTGRIGLIHLYPFNLSEIHNKEFARYWQKRQKIESLISIKEFERNLKSGGMPGFFHLHDESEYNQMVQQWVETTCVRDLSQVIKKNFDPELALKIYSAIANTEMQYSSEVAVQVRKDNRIVGRYLDAFCEIFALVKSTPHTVSVGKDRYFYPDSGIAKWIGASDPLTLETHCLHQALSYFETFGFGKPIVNFYKTPKKSYVPFIFSWTGGKNQFIVQICDSEHDFRLQEAANLSFMKNLEKAKIKSAQIRQIFLYQGMESYFEGEKEFYPIRG